MFIFDSLPGWQLLFSAFCHLVYLQNFAPQWPLISLTSWTFLASAALVITDHFLWFFYFARVTAAARHQRSHYRYSPPLEVQGFGEIATFFGICVWLVPLFLFLSLSANDNAIPMTAGWISSSQRSDQTTDKHTLGTDGVPQTSTTKSRVSLFRSLFSAGVPRRSRRDSDGLIAPRTPSSPRPDPMGSSSLNDLIRSDSFIPPPPRSPGGSRIGSPDLPAPSSFELREPPKRFQSFGETGLGVRRTGSFQSENHM